MSISLRRQPKNKESCLLSFMANQQGSSLILALFVIIILTLLGTVLTRIISTSSETVSQEVLGTRAYMAANSAMQTELQFLFPLNPLDGDVVTCNEIEKTHVLNQASGVDIPGFNHCEAFTTCDNYYSDTEDPLAVVQYYRLTSTGECGSGDIDENSKATVKSSRTIQVEARSL
jgi:MSHA biogenesis protein MshP